MSNEESDVSALITALKEGAMSLDEVAQRFRKRTWPASHPPSATSYLEMAERAMQDPDTDVPGSFDEVVAAYDRHELTREQYRTLAEAVAEAIRSEYSSE